MGFTSYVFNNIQFLLAAHIKKNEDNNNYITDNVKILRRSQKTIATDLLRPYTQLPHCPRRQAPLLVILPGAVRSKVVFPVVEGLSDGVARAGTSVKAQHALLFQIFLAVKRGENAARRGGGGEKRSG